MCSTYILEVLRLQKLITQAMFSALELQYHNTLKPL